MLPLFGPRWEVQPHLHMHSLVTREEGRAVVGVTSPPPHISSGPARTLEAQGCQTELTARMLS